MSKISIKSATYTGLIFLLVISQILQYRGLGFIGYLDELYEVIAVWIIAIHWNKTNKADKKNLFIVVAFVFVGLLGNVLFKYQDSFNLIALDIVATLKGILFYYGIKYSRISSRDCYRIVKHSSKLFMILCIVMMAFAIANLFVEIGMSTEARYGIKGFRFLAPNEGTCSLMFYVIMATFLCEAVYDKRISKKNRIGIVLALAVWSMTLRSRAIAFSFLFVVLAFRFLAKKRTKKIKAIEIIGILGAAYFFGRDQIKYYFGNVNTARYNLLAYGIKNLKRFFPIGSGFATYGSEMAARDYSTLYKEYGFDSVWGLAQDNLKFANDSLWGEIFGQFGLIGTVLFILIFFTIFMNHKKLVDDNIGRLFFTYIIVILVFGTTGTKTFFHFTIVPTFMFIALAERYYTERKRGIIDG